MPEQNTTDAPETAEASEPADAPASRPLTQRGLDRRRALLMHSADLFIEVGYERTSIREIIARAGGSRSLIYQCFKNKHGLFLACLQMTVDDVYSSYVQEGRKGLTLDEELLTFGRIFLEHMTNRRALGLLRLIFSETTRFHEIGEWYWREGVMQSWVCFARVMRDYVDLPDEELIDAARSYINLLKGGLVEECLANPSLVPTEARIRAEVERAAGWIADALRALSARSFAPSRTAWRSPRPGTTSRLWTSTRWGSSPVLRMRLMPLLRRPKPSPPAPARPARRRLRRLLTPLTPMRSSARRRPSPPRSPRPAGLSPT